MKSPLLLLVCLLIPFSSPAQYEANWESLDQRPVPAWFKDAKFGIFIHWGLYSVPAWGPTKDVSIYEKYAEWYWYSLSDPDRDSHEQFEAFHHRVYGEDFTYPEFAPEFRAELFEPEEWARIFRESGARYVVLTSKHHEGYCLWPSEYAWNWNALEIGPKRDLAGELTSAVKDEGLKMGFYYSLYEWFNPLYHRDVDAYVDNHMLPQMKELVTRYEPDLLWTDGEWDHPAETWRSPEFLAWLYNDSPVGDNIAVNDRWGNNTRGKHGGFWTTEYDLYHGQEDIGEARHYWEECRGIGTSFGYNRNEYLENYSSSEELVEVLIEKVARGGNLLLNVGPTADGRIPVIMQQRLADIGRWLKVNGEGIYGTFQWADAPEELMEQGIFFTRKDNELFVICTRFPEQPVKVPGITAKQVTLLGYEEEVMAGNHSGKLVIEPPALTPANNQCEYAWVFRIEGAF